MEKWHAITQPNFEISHFDEEGAAWLPLLVYVTLVVRTRPQIPVARLTLRNDGCPTQATDNAIGLGFMYYVFQPAM